METELSAGELAAVPATIPTARASWARRARGAVSTLDRPHATILIGSLSIVIFIVYSAFGPLPYGPYQTDPAHLLQAPTSQHLLGTDALGRDVLSRVIAAARTDLLLTLGGTALALAIGVPLGLLVSTKSKASEYAMRVLDLFQSFPVLILAVGLVAVAGDALWIVVIAIAVVFFPVFVRLTRAQALHLRESRFIEAATAIGCSKFRLRTRHLLPNLMAIIFVQAAVTVSRSLLLISTLSFLGVGIRPPTASWGAMVQQGSEQIATGVWWGLVFPGLAIVLCVLIFNLIGDALEVVSNRGARG